MKRSNQKYRKHTRRVSALARRKIELEDWLHRLEEIKLQRVGRDKDIASYKFLTKQIDQVKDKINKAKADVRALELALGVGK